MGRRWWGWVGLLAVACAGPRATTRAEVGQALTDRTGAALRAGRLEGPDLPPGVELGDGLGPREAVALALWNNPDWELELTRLGLARADVITAGMLTNPTLSGLIPLGPRQWQIALRLPIEALWLRPLRLAEARSRDQAVGERLVQTGLDLTRDVGQAYVRASAARAREELLAQAAEQRRTRTSLLQAQVAAGDLSLLALDVAVRDEVLSETLRRVADEDDRQRRVTLGVLLGVEEADGLRLEPLERLVPPPVLIAEAEWIALALERRPELAAAALDRQASLEAARVAKASVVSAALGVHVQGGGTSTNQGPGLTPDLTLPLFDHNQDEIARARARQDEAEARIAAVTARIRAEVRDSLGGLRSALADREELLAQAAPAAEASARRAHQAFALGDLSRLDVAIADAALVDSRLALLDADERAALAAIALDRALGGANLREGL